MDEEPTPIVTDDTDVPPAVEAKAPPGELEERLTVVAEVTLTGLPDAFSIWHTIGPSVALFEAAPETGDVVITSLVAVDPLTTVSDIAEPQALAAELLFESPP